MNIMFIVFVIILVLIFIVSIIDIITQNYYFHTLLTDRKSIKLWKYIFNNVEKIKYVEKFTSDIFKNDCLLFELKDGNFHFHIYAFDNDIFGDGKNIKVGVVSEYSKNHTGKILLSWFNLGYSKKLGKILWEKYDNYQIKYQ